MTIEQSLKLLPSPYGQMAITEIERQGYFDLDIPAGTDPVSLLSCTFLWDDSIFGANFWIGIISQFTERNEIL